MKNMANRDGVIFYDGAWVKWRDATTHVLTHTLHYGMGVFEGLRAYNTKQGPAIFRLRDHTNRLYNSAKIMNMVIPFDKKDLLHAQQEAVLKNNLSSAYLRPMVFYGSEGMGLRADNLRVHVIIAAWEWGSYLGEESLNNGISVKTSSYTRHHANITMTRAKANGNYVNSMLALQEALKDGYDEALLLDAYGFVAEGSGENIFIVSNGAIYTPDLTSALSGITRDSVFRIAKDLGYSVTEKRLTRDDVYCADEVFFTGTAAEITPIRELDNRIIGDGKRGKITTQIQQIYFDSVYGKNANYYDEWVAPGLCK